MSSFLGGIVGNVSGALGVGSIGRATVGLVLDDQGYNANLQKAKAQTEASTVGMSNSFLGLGASSTAAFAVAATAAATFAKISIQAAIEQKEAQDKLANSIANSSSVTFDSLDAFDAQASSLQSLTGVQDETITSAQAMAVQFGLTADQVKALTPLVVDLSQKNGVDLTTAMSAVGKAVNGNSGALARLKLNVDKAAFAEDHFAATQKALESGVKGYAEQLANDEPWRKVEANVHELEESVGKGLLPVLQHASAILADLGQKDLPSVSDTLPFITAGFRAAAAAGGVWDSAIQQAGTDAAGFQQQIDEVNASLAKGTITASDAVSQVRRLAEAHGFDADTVNRLSTAEENAAASMARATAETQKNTLALRANRNQVLSDAGGLLGLSANLAQLADDEAAVSKARRQGTLDTKAGQAAERAYLTDKIAFIQALQQEKQEMLKSHDTTEQIVNTLTRLGRAAGITRQQIQGLTADINGLPSNKQVNINVHSYRSGFAVGPV
jgi:hypothetical protein